MISAARAALVAGVVLLLPACAAGVARVASDGTCEARGVALGRASVVAYRAGAVAHRVESEVKSEEVDARVCASLDGGTGSAGFWATIGGAVGALAGWLAAP